MSMTSRPYRFFRFLSQNRLMFFTASVDFDVDPLTYKRRRYFGRESNLAGLAAPADAALRFPAGLLFLAGFCIGSQTAQSAFCKSRPTSARTLSERSPISLRAGGGS